MAKVRQDIILNLSGIGDFFVNADDPTMMIYKLIVDNVIFRSVAGADKSELNFKP